MVTRRMTAEERARIFKALADPRRVDIIDMLASTGGSLCGTELAQSLGISVALVCHHWEVLVDAGILKKERVGQLRICTLDVERIRQATGGWAALEGPVAKEVKPKRGRVAPRGPARKASG